MLGLAASFDVINITKDETRSIYDCQSLIEPRKERALTKASAAVANNYHPQSASTHTLSGNILNPTDKEPVDTAAYI